MMNSFIDVSDITAKWIHKDERGEIFCFYEGGREYTLLTTRKGFARGGCVHPRHCEYFVVLKGMVRYVVVHDGIPYGEVFIEGSNGVIDMNEPHYLLALEDSITLEWGADPDEKAMKHPVWRNVVEEINKRRAQELENNRGICNGR